MCTQCGGGGDGAAVAGAQCMRMSLAGRGAGEVGRGQIREAFVGYAKMPGLCSASRRVNDKIPISE